MRVEIPNLELIMYIARTNVMASPEWKAKFENYKREWHEQNPDARWVIFPEFVIDSVFLQMWGSTALGFDGNIGGCAMTEAYTTVVHERTTDTYAVFFDGVPCYMVYDPNEVFLEDLKNHMLAGKTRAARDY